MPSCKMTVTFWIPVTGGILQWAVSDYNGYLFRPTGPIRDTMQKAMTFSNLILV